MSFKSYVQKSKSVSSIKKCFIESGAVRTHTLNTYERNRAVTYYGLVSLFVFLNREISTSG